MIIQFSHNGEQLNLSRRTKLNNEAFHFDNDSKTSGYRYWNNEKFHKRKFINQSGWYLEKEGDSFNPTPKRGSLYFWGEWEPQSRFELTGNSISNKNLPHAVHNPIFSKRGMGGHNTDPFVFGNRFYYTNCKQTENGKGLKMLHLDPNSIIIFGSEIDRSKFVIDTVFVVKSSSSVKDYRSETDDYPELLRKATIDSPIGLADWNKIYAGKMHDIDSQFLEGSMEMFSFVPCMVDCPKEGFPRPTIDVAKFGLQKPGAGTVLQSINFERGFVESPEHNFWLDLISELASQGYSLGIKLDMPESNDTIDFPEYASATNNCVSQGY
jgi:hypothetical protein